MLLYSNPFHFKHSVTICTRIKIFILVKTNFARFLNMNMWWYTAAPTYYAHPKYIMSTYTYNNMLISNFFTSACNMISGSAPDLAPGS